MLLQEEVQCRDCGSATGALLSRMHKPIAVASMLRLVGMISGGAIAAALLIGAVGILLPSQSAPTPDPRGEYVIEGVRVVDVVTGLAGPPLSVVIRDGIITDIAERVPADRLVRVDGHGLFAVPGFWDMHMHSFQLSPQMHFPLWIANGVTSVRDMMDCPGHRDTLIACAADKRHWSSQSDRGRLAAPRFIEVASYYLEGPELSPAEAAARVRAYRSRGIDAVKVYNRLSRGTYLRAAAEARASGMRLVGHLPKTISLEDALTAGQSSFEHAHLFPRHCFPRAADWRQGRLDLLSPTILTETIVAEHDPAACSAIFGALQRAEAWYVPTHVTREEDARAGDPSFSDDPRLDYLDPLSRWAFRDDLAGTRERYSGSRGERAVRVYFEHGLRLTGEAHAAGVRVLVGTDTVLGGFRYHDEMAHLVRAGLTPAEVLRAATIDAARYAGLQRTSGSIAVGKRADLVLLEANPLDNIGNTRRIRAVFLNGRLYDRERLDELLAFTRSQAAAPHNWVKLLWGFVRSSVTSDF